VALGALGILAFSFSLPATKLAVGGLDPWLVAAGRAVVAALLAAAVLAAVRAPRPSAAQVRSLAVVALGVVVGFPVFTSLALEERESAHAAVVIALLPICTALFAVLRAGERPSPRFWGAAGLGAASVLAFAVTAGAGELRASDVHLLAAVVLCGLGYAEGGALSRTLGGARTICWALLVALPVTVPATVLAVATSTPLAAGADAWLGFAYVSAVSMFLGFFAWYGGLARGGVARVGQVQLAQPVLTLGWSALVLGETVGPATLGAAVLVLASVALTQRARVGHAPGHAARRGPRARAGLPRGAGGPPRHADPAPRR
jgi:drug/metabolite transporter (DMT)-like permease